MSRNISRLERAVGVTPLRRTSRKVELTPLGLEYYERCRKLVEDAAAAHEQLVLASASPRGRIRMSVPVDFGLIFIAPALVEFATRFRELTFDVDMSPRRVDIVDERFDLAIRVGALAHSSTLITRRLATVAVALYAAPSYLEAAGTPEAPEELVKHSCLRVLLPAMNEPWALFRGRHAHHRRSAKPISHQQPGHAETAHGRRLRHRRVRCRRRRRGHPRRSPETGVAGLVDADLAHQPADVGTASSSNA